MGTQVGLDYASIVQKAALLADQKGLEALTMADLAAALNVRTPTLYHYFKGVAGMRRALSLYGIRESSARLGRAVMGKAGDEAVLAMAHAMYRFAQEHPGVYEATQRAPDPADEEWRTAGKEFVELIILALSGFNLSNEEARHVVRMLRIIVHGTVSLEHIGGFGDPIEIEETFQRLLNSLLAYLNAA